jgi:hypothetical protein
MGVAAVPGTIPWKGPDWDTEEIYTTPPGRESLEKGS